MALWNRGPKGYMVAAVDLLGLLEEDSSSEKLYRTVFMKINEMMKEGANHAMFINRRSTGMELAFNQGIPADKVWELNEDLQALKDGFDKPFLLPVKGEEILICPIFTPEKHYLVGVVAIGGEFSYLRRAIQFMKRKPAKEYLFMIGTVFYQIEQRVEKEYEYYCDALTGLHDECMLRKDLNHLVEISGTGEYVFILLGVNQLASINDLYGYAKGNEVLAGVGKAFAKVVATKESAYRLGGDKFVLLLRSGYRRAYERVEKVLTEISELTLYGEDSKESSKYHISMAASIVDLNKLPIEPCYVDKLYRYAFDYLPKDSSISLYGQRRVVLEAPAPLSQSVTEIAIEPVSEKNKEDPVDFLGDLFHRTT